MLSVFSHLGTTTTILLWSFLFSLGAVVVSFELLSWLAKRAEWDSVSRHPSGVSASKIIRAESFLVMPAIILVPLSIWFSYGSFGLNLIFPPALLASHFETIVHCIFPAIILLIGSGFLSSVFPVMGSEMRFWSGKAFAIVAVSLGKDLHRELRFLVVFKTFVDLWARALPWYFGELIVVEALFNAPGLGLYLWESTRQLDYVGALSSAAIIIALFAVFNVANRSISNWIGCRLETYG